MFFFLSKTLGLLVMPLVVLLGVLLVALWFGIKGRRRAAICWGSAAVVLLGIGEFTSLGSMALQRLEDQIPRATGWQSGDGPEGFIVLGGAISQRQSNSGRGEIALNGAAERMTTVLALARQYPQARVVFSGFSGMLNPEGDDEGALSYRLMTELGMDPARIELERQSRNTAENAQQVAALLKDRPPERWVLITSAYHMPRAVGCFQATGWVPQPWPVDYHTPSTAISFGLEDGQLGIWTGVLHELVGLITYAATGKIPAVWPQP